MLSLDLNKNKLLHALPGVVTSTGVGVLLGNAIHSYLSGTIPLQEAIYQAAIGIIGLGLRRALSRLSSRQ